MNFFYSLWCFSYQVLKLTKLFNLFE